MSQARQHTYRRLRRRLKALLAALRPRSWDADQIAAALTGCTVQRARFGRLVVRDRRFDQPHRGNGGELPQEELARLRASAASGRWR